MEEILTDDKSLTYRHPKLDEPYHTKAGAVTEALEKHARALKVWEKENPVIFDVCSGLSYSAACAFEEIRSHGNDSFVTIYLFENDRSILEKNLELPDVLEYVQGNERHKITCFCHFKKAIQNYLENNDNIYQPQSEGLCIVLMFGDFRDTIEEVGESADYVFYAPFAPDTTPDMWALDAFEKLHQHTALNGKLSTYSYARPVREALRKAGFRVADGPTLGRRSPSTIAVKG